MAYPTDTLAEEDTPRANGKPGFPDIDPYRE